MALYTCERCGYQSNFKANFLRHLKHNKQPCKPHLNDVSITELLAKYTSDNTTTQPCLTCQFCNTVFHNTANKSRHMKTCKSKHLSNTPQTPTHTTQINSNNSNTVNTVNNNYQQNITINIKNFGCENINHILENKDFLNSCLSLRNITYLIESIHCDPLHQENHNVRIKSTKQEIMETFVNGKWILTDQDDTLDELVKKGYRVLKSHMHKNKNDIIHEYQHDDYQDFTQWLESVYDDHKIRKPMKKQLLLLFLNNKTLLLSKDS